MPPASPKGKAGVRQYFGFENDTQIAGTGMGLESGARSSWIGLSRRADHYFVYVYMGR